MVEIMYTVADLRDFHGFPDVRPFEEDARGTGAAVVSGCGVEVIGQDCQNSNLGYCLF